LGELNRRHRTDFHAALDEVLDGERVLFGQFLTHFEARMAEIAGTRHFLGTASGLDAIALLLLAKNFPEGSEVLVPANSFVASALGIVRAGLSPVPVDIDPGTGNLDPGEISRKATSRTRAILAVHLHGIPAPMEEIRREAEARGLAVLEDAAQAHGASLNGRPCGSLGNGAAFSFYPGKNLGALADAGGIACDDDALAGLVELWRNYGSREKYRHELPGWNSRLSELDAAILLAKCAGLEPGNARRREIAARYRKEISNPALRLPSVPCRATPCWHLFPVLCRQRDALRTHLATLGIETLIHYPVPIHRQECFPKLHALNLPGAEEWCGQTLSIPLHPLLTESEVARVLDALNSFRP
jgi:dTDP-4-amino-4,6-dideoxygalactose transaminase